MRQETLLRALVAVRERLAAADRHVAGWLAERDRRRRQEAVFLRAIVRLEGTQRAAAIVTGISQPVISRTLDREGHAKQRKAQAKLDDVRNQNLTSPPDDNPEEPMVTTNVVKLRRRRRDWKPRRPRRAEVLSWINQFLGWDPETRETARLIIRDSKGTLPDDAYISEDEPKPSDGNRAVGTGQRRA
jgi:hypothetical protein